MQCSTSGRPAAGVLQRTSPATSVRVAALLRGVHANERRNLASVLSTKAGAPCGELNRSSIEEHSAAELQLDRPGPSSCIAGTVAALHAVAAVELLDILQPAHAQASEALSGSSFELFSSFLVRFRSLPILVVFLPIWSTTYCWLPACFACRFACYTCCSCRRCSFASCTCCATPSHVDRHYLLYYLI